MTGRDRDGGGEGEFLSRWSRRKQEARAAPEPEPEPEAPPPAEATPEPGPDIEAMSDDELLAHFELPDPETLAKGDDFTPFLARAIPERLRRRALRRLWLSNPLFNFQDGMDEYAEDFTDAAVLTGPVKTSYQVGKGMRAHTEWLERQAELAEAEGDASEGGAEDADEGTEEAPVEAETPPEPAPETPPEPEELAGPAEETPPENPVDPAPTGDDPETGSRPVRRRMVFRTVEESRG